MTHIRQHIGFGNNISARHFKCGQMSTAANHRVIDEVIYKASCSIPVRIADIPEIARWKRRRFIQCHIQIECRRIGQLKCNQIRRTATCIMYHGLGQYTAPRIQTRFINIGSDEFHRFLLSILILILFWYEIVRRRGHHRTVEDTQIIRHERYRQFYAPCF